VVIAASFGPGCTVTMYQGPKRPAFQTALIRQGGASIQSIDWTPVPVGSQFVVLPGPHTVEARSGNGEAVAVCFDARAGHDYRVDGDGEHPVILDYADTTMRTYRVLGGQICERVIAQAEADRRAAARRLAAPPAESGPPVTGSEPPVPTAASADRARMPPTMATPRPGQPS